MAVAPRLIMRTDFRRSDDASRPVADSADAVTRTFVCADVVGFAAFAERVGDRRALEAMRRLAKRIRCQIEIFGGRELEMRGDCFLIVFPCALAGLYCAIGIQRALTAERADCRGEKLDVRIAQHSGAVLRDGGRFFGRNLILVFRLLDLATAGEILLSSASQNHVFGRWIGEFTAERVFVPRGFQSEIHFSAVRWRHGSRSITMGART